MSSELAIFSYPGEGMWMQLNGNTYIQQHQLANQPSTNASAKLLPRSSLSSTALASGTQELTFQLPKSPIDQLNALYLQFTANNANVGQLDLVDGFSFIDYVQIELDNVPIQTLYGAAMRKDFCLSADLDSRLAGPASAVFIDPVTFDSTLDIAGAGSEIVTIPLYQSLFSVADVPMSAAAGEWSITFRFRTGGPSLVRSTSVGAIADLTVTNYSLILNGQILSESAKNQRIHASRGKDFLYRYYNITRESLSLGTSVSGTANSQNYTSNGQLAMIHLDLHNNVVGNGEQIYNPSAITSFELLMNQNVVSHGLGDNAYSYSFHQTRSGEFFPNQALITTKPTASIVFSEEPMELLRNGTNLGSRRVGGNSESIRIVPGANIASSRLDCYSYWYSTLIIDKFGRATPDRNNAQA